MQVTEKYHCSYGISPEYLPIFESSELDVSGYDLQGDPRTIEIKSHPFFIGTAYQPERAALNERNHPLVESFVRVAAMAHA